MPVTLINSSAREESSYAMPVILLNSSGREESSCTLYGKPFPPDDIKAYWSMVPGDIVVNFAAGCGIFTIRKLLRCELYHTGIEVSELSHEVVSRLYISDAFKLSAWMDVISRVVNSGKQHTV